MATIVTRSGKGSPLTNAEVDANFTNLNDDKAELSGANFTGSIDVTGTVTADGLTVEKSGAVGATINRTTSSGATVAVQVVGSTVGTLGSDTGGNGRFDISSVSGGASGDAVQISHTGGTPSALFASNGDISFYEDTGTTPKFFWDASAERLGLGTTSPAELLDVNGHINLADGYELKWGGAGATIYGSNSNNQLRLYTNNAVRMLIDSSGVVKLITANDTAGTEKFLTFGTNSFNRAGIKCTNAATYDGSLEFYTGNSSTFEERARIDSSGNLLVGTTNTAPATNNVKGIALRNEGHINVSRDSGVVGYFNRKTDDGTILDFRKDGTQVGSIGSLSGTAYVAGSSKGIRFGSAGLIPATSAGANSDNTFDLGDAAVRWKDLYLSGGVYLGGTAAANLLDDYEEGTWTPTIEGATSGSITGFTISGANYTKVGRVINLNCYLSSVDITSSTISGDVRIRGLPFTSANFTGIVSSTYCNWFTADEADTTVSGYTQGTEVVLKKGSSTSSWSSADFLITVTTGVIMISLTYMTS